MRTRSAEVAAWARCETRVSSDARGNDAGAAACESTTNAVGADSGCGDDAAETGLADTADEETAGAAACSDVSAPNTGRWFTCARVHMNVRSNA